MSDKKRFLFRLDGDIHAALERWAADELRSVNAQIEYLLTDLVRKSTACNGNRTVINGTVVVSILHDLEDAGRGTSAGMAPTFPRPISLHLALVTRSRVEYLIMVEGLANSTDVSP
jgi:hypothetical protein